MKRRRFLGFSAGAAAGAAAGGAASRAFIGMLAEADSALYPPRGPESFALSVCGMCPAACGIRVRRIGDRVVKVDGNPLHPVSGGRLCPRGQAAPQGLYHPDRLAGPMRRVGPRGAIGSFRSVSWERALEEIASRLRALREAGRPESLALVRGSFGGISLRLARRFLTAFGSPNDVALDRGEEAAALAQWLTQGVRIAPAYDIQASDYVLSFGGALLEASASPVHTMRAYGNFRQGRLGRRGKLVQVEPRLSLTAAAADEWIAVWPGTEGILALGIAGVLVAEGLYDRAFVADHAIGFEDRREAGAGVRPGLRTLLGRHYALEPVAERTGVPVHTILRLAREFAAARTRLAVGPRRGPLLPGGLFDHLAVHTLNALIGSLDSPGGVLVPEETPLLPWPPLPQDPVAERGRARARLDGAGGRQAPLLASDPERLADAILGGSPYGVEALFVLGADPVFASAAPDRFAAALERVPLTVSFATLPDDTALHADFILPEAHFLERWDLVASPPGIPFPMASLAKPVVPKPLHDVRPAGEVFLELARRLGGAVASALPWNDVPSLLRAEMDGLYGARRGALMGTAFDEAWVRMMEQAGWWTPGYRSPDELWVKAQETGGWWDPFYEHGDWKRILRTPSERFEFRAELVAPEPEPSSALADGRLTLLLFEPLPIAGGTGAEYPFLQAILDPGHEGRRETWMEIHPQTAAALGIADRDWVQVASDRAAISVRARVSPRVVTGVVAIPVGLGKHGGGRWARGLGANPLRLLSQARDPLCGLADFGGTSVRVARLAEPVDVPPRRAGG